MRGGARLGQMPPQKKNFANILSCIDCCVCFCYSVSQIQSMERMFPLTERSSLMIETLKELIVEQLTFCKNEDLLDLVWKLLLSENG